MVEIWIFYTRSNSRDVVWKYLDANEKLGP